MNHRRGVDDHQESITICCFLSARSQNIVDSWSDSYPTFSFLLQALLRSGHSMISSILLLYRYLGHNLKIPLHLKLQHPHLRRGYLAKTGEISGPHGVFRDRIEVPTEMRYPSIKWSTESIDALVLARRLIKAYDSFVPLFHVVSFLLNFTSQLNARIVRSTLAHFFWIGKYQFACFWTTT